MAGVIKTAAHCSHRKVQPAPKYTFNADSKVYIWATLAHKVVSLSWTFMMMFSTTALPVIWPCSLSLWNTSILSLQCFCANMAYPHFLLLQMATLKCCPHLAMTDSVGAWRQVFPHVFPFTASAADTHGFLSCCGFFFLCATRRRLTTNNDWGSNHSRFAARDLFFQLACKHTHRVCVRERERLTHA